MIIINSLNSLLLIAFSPPSSYKNSLQQWAEDPEAKNDQDEKEEEEKEKLEEKDDEFNLQKARAWDDWKDGEFLESVKQVQTAV